MQISKDSIRDLLIDLEEGTEGVVEIEERIGLFDTEPAIKGVAKHIYYRKEGSYGDVQLLEETGNGRDINRHYYSVEEAKDALDKPVVKALLDLCRFRNTHPAFGGEVGPTCRQLETHQALWPVLPQFGLTGRFQLVHVSKAHERPSLCKYRGYGHIIRLGA